MWTNARSWGGVVLASQDGKIVCDNTLDARVDVSFRQKLPEVPPHRCPCFVLLCSSPRWPFIMAIISV
jgi:hypothetical protein